MIYTRHNRKAYHQRVHQIHRKIPNCPITKHNILRAEDKLGPNLRSLKGKTTRKTPSKVILNTLDMPDGLLEEHGNATLTVDVI